uniref:Uncharacterized protein AlNc14C2G227 n=1 Tax=Albugo laibachii Nc14 TaxID=890382 RepID=F0VZ86_9STRA|nr:hypothetical protein LOC100382497 [Albugo laibachii Nc14]|eukprot:CCA14116.1 hypothetical protein LOC100382497 [Albugo laibachii Nc14]
MSSTSNQRSLRSTSALLVKNSQHEEFTCVSQSLPQRTLQPNVSNEILPSEPKPIKTTPSLETEYWSTGQLAMDALKTYCLENKKSCKLDKPRSGGNIKYIICTSATPCPWFVKISRVRKSAKFVAPGAWRVSSKCLEHRNCVGLPAPRAKDLARLPFFQELIHANPDVPIRYLQAQLMASVALLPNERTIYRAKDKLTFAAMDQPYITSFQYIIPFLKKLEQLNPGTKTVCETEEDEPRFKRAIIIPSISIQASQSALQNVYGLDATRFQNRHYKGYQITVIGKDGAMEELLIAIAIVPLNDTENLTWVLNKVQSAGIPLEKRIVIVPDRVKAQPTVNATAPDFIQCTRHLIDSLVDSRKLAPQSAGYVWQAQGAETRDEFEIVMNSLQKSDPEAFRSLSELNPRTWAVFANSDRKLYGWNTTRFEDLEQQFVIATSGSDPQTSSDVASRPRWNEEDKSRTLSPYDFLSSYIGEMMATVFHRNQNAQKWDQLHLFVTPAAEQLFQEEMKHVGEYFVRPCKDNIIFVKHNSPASRTRKVDLAQKYCSCLLFNQHGVPCRHIVAALHWKKALGNAYSFFDPCYRVASYANTFRNKWLEFPLHEELERDESLLPPRKRTSTKLSNTCENGSIPKKRKRVNAKHVRTYKCSNCNSLDHNRRTCSTEWLAPHTSEQV